MGVDTSPQNKFIMDYYLEHLKMKIPMSVIDQQNIWDYLDMIVYRAAMDYKGKVTELDSSNF